MRVFAVVTLIALTLVSCEVWGQQNPVRKMEAPGDSAGARTALARAVAANPNSIPALTAYAEFLERYGDPASRGAYAKLLAALQTSSDSARSGVIAGRLAALDL